MLPSHPAKALRLEGYGLEKGCNADLVLLQARDPIEAIRMKATRLAVVKGGSVIARTPARRTSLALDGRPDSIDPMDYAPVEDECGL